MYPEFDIVLKKKDFLICNIHLCVLSGLDELASGLFKWPCFHILMKCW